jgi:hypothetical protein
MFDYLEKILGKSSRWYEMLMRSKNEKSNITAVEINLAATLLEPLIIPAQLVSFANDDAKIVPKSALSSWPKNNKGFDLPYYGSIQTATRSVNLFVNEEKLAKDATNLVMEVILNGAATSNLQPPSKEFLQNKNWFYQETPSLPIWEEVIHRDLAIHKKLVAMAPGNPWTLYKEAKAQLIATDSTANLIGGYPQWKLNDRDFRKLKDATFLFQITLTTSHLTYFIFFNKDGVFTELQ